MNIRHAVVILGSDRTSAHLRRFEDPQNTIRECQKLPPEFQCELYGPNEWFVIKILSPRAASILEGLTHIAGKDIAQDLAREIFEAGLKVFAKALK